MKSVNKYSSGSILLISLVSIISLMPLKSSGQEYAIGADLSFLKARKTADLFSRRTVSQNPDSPFSPIMGYNWIRLRLFHTPTNLPNNLDYTIALAKSARALGMKFLLDYHYSDTWADPGKAVHPKGMERNVAYGTGQGCFRVFEGNYKSIPGRRCYARYGPAGQ